MIRRTQRKIKLNWKLIVKVPYKKLRRGLELVVPKDHDGYEADDSDSDVCSTSSRDTLILGPFEAGKCQLIKY